MTIVWGCFLLASGGIPKKNGLTDKQKRFCDEYLIDLNATQAAIRAGYSEETARNIGCENLAKPNIAEYLEKRMERREKKTEVTQEFVLRELLNIASANGTDFALVDDLGLARIIPTNQVAETKRSAIAAIKAGANGTEVKTYDKLRALELIGKHLGMFSERQASNGREVEDLSPLASMLGDDDD